MKNYEKLASGPGIQPNTGKHEPPKRIPNLKEQGFVPAAIDVERCAYEIYQKKGGSAVENWLEAERLLKEEHTRSFEQNHGKKAG